MSANLTADLGQTFWKSASQNRGGVFLLPTDLLTVSLLCQQIRMRQSENIAGRNGDREVYFCRQIY